MAYAPKPVAPPMAVLACVFGIVAFGALALWVYEVNHDAIATAMEHGATALREWPWPVFYLAIALLPFVLFPVSVLFVSAGAVHGIGPSLAGITAAMAVNVSLSYWLAAGPLRRLIGRWFAWRGRTVPVLPADEAVWAVLLVRFTPGLPLLLQNFLLGLARVPFRTYFLVSLLAEVGIAFGFILAGRVLSENKPGYVLAAFGCIVAALLVARLLRRVFARQVHPVAEVLPTENGKGGPDGSASRSER